MALLLSTLLIILALGGPLTTWGTVNDYDQAIAEDAGAGLVPLARLRAPVQLSGSDRVPFDFGSTGDDTTMEFILEGDPDANVGSYLAVGENTHSNLRYELWFDTGQLGFTELGVLDYAFDLNPPSPTEPTHVTYVWNASDRSMDLYLNGVAAGSRAGVSASFAMPRGAGWLGANPSGGEGMVGTVYRVTVYAGRLRPEVILAHAKAFQGIAEPPAIDSFTASVPALFTPAMVTLKWAVRNAHEVRIDGQNVTGLSERTVAPTATHTYQLVANNAGGSSTAEVTVLVNPPPVIVRFEAAPVYPGAGEAVTLRWAAEYAQTVTIEPGLGDVTGLTVAGAGSVSIQPAAATMYRMTVGNGYGSATASVTVRPVEAAKHVVISEFMADDQSTFPDENGDYSGWIELYNPTSQTVNLEGSSLTDELDLSRRWLFPRIDLPPDAYLVVFASGNDKRVPGAPLHTNFRLANEGEFLALIDPTGDVLHAFAPAFPAQRPDISYGLLGGDTNLVQFFGKPTPGGPNNDAPAPPASVQISEGSRVFRDPFEVRLTATEPSLEIRFTLDGSVPGLTNGLSYAAPIQMTNTTRLRAVAVADGQAGPVSGASYIRLGPDLVGYTSSLPIMVIENFGAGTIPRKGWNSTGAGIKQVPRQTAAWVTFEREGGVSSFTNAPQMFSLVGIRGRGAYSTEWRQKPYSIEGMDEGGGDRKVAPLGMPAHADWVLYFPDSEQSRDPTLLFNTFAYELSRQMGRGAVRFRWVEAFVNENGGDLRLADRRGVYAIIEKVARGKDRLDFQPLSADGASGSWLLNINRMDPIPEAGWPAPNGATRPWFFRTAGPNRIIETKANTSYSDVPGDDLPQQPNGYLNFDNPNGYVISTNQRAAIEGWFARFEDVFYNDGLWLSRTNGYRQYLDTRDFIDYFILNVLTRNGDGLLISMFPWKGDDNKLRMGPAWDYNWSSYYIGGEPTGALMHRAEQLWYPRLFSDPDFGQEYIDRWWELRRGPLGNDNLGKIIDDQAAEITPAKAALNGFSDTAEWPRRLRQMKDWLTRRADWIDGSYLRPPSFSQMGGEVPIGFGVGVAGTGGTIYYTTDGTDPRAPGGLISQGARVYAGPVIIRERTLLQARAKTAGAWSGLTRALFGIPQDLTRLVVTEIMYDPPSSPGTAGEDLEFLELQNVGTNSLQLGGLHFTSGIEFTFGEDATLGPGEFFLLARNPAAIVAAHPGAVVHGVYTGKLNNDGETLRVATANGATVFEITFGRAPPWPAEAAGFGFSLVPRGGNNPNASDPSSWQRSASIGGSPGRAEPPPEPECTPGLAPIILQGPLSQEVVAGAWIGLSVSVTNTALLPITYRWQRNGEDVPGGTFVLDRHQAFLAVADGQLPYTKYTVHVSNSACPAGFTSDQAILSFLADTDQDGQPDVWESTYGLDPVSRPIAIRMSTAMASAAARSTPGANPRDAGSCLKVEASVPGPGSGAHIKFRAVSHRTYSLEYTDSLAAETWVALEEIVAEASDREVIIVDPRPTAQRFYRVVTPKVPSERAQRTMTRK
ncbi:MAG: CotH kinase family protein [Verrucomicrobiota bacterium]